MSTLVRDLGGDMRVQLHLDAAAAKGIIERRGLSKIRHLDVNVLWLRETCARRVQPVMKVPGESIKFGPPPPFFPSQLPNQVLRMTFLGFVTFAFLGGCALNPFRFLSIRQPQQHFLNHLH